MFNRCVVWPSFAGTCNTSHLGCSPGISDDDGLTQSGDVVKTQQALDVETKEASQDGGRIAEPVLALR